ncbi:hypothetical protein VFPBJ_05996 [Purpureocillium lilacinum]|uniref:Uncharacterized protein n=1 Tax=Purpureocillium lilacinum TaxID=33203 RepID=A0A179GSZ7_PURLI|nr:hypothetical protein VFPBJ_05996 [Purpureocillium lilacinum]
MSIGCGLNLGHWYSSVWPDDSIHGTRLKEAGADGECRLLACLTPRNGSRRLQHEGGQASFNHGQMDSHV